MWIAKFIQQAPGFSYIPHVALAAEAMQGLDWLAWRSGGVEAPDVRERSADGCGWEACQLCSGKLGICYSSIWSDPTSPPLTCTSCCLYAYSLRTDHLSVAGCSSCRTQQSDLSSHDATALRAKRGEASVPFWH